MIIYVLILESFSAFFINLIFTLLTANTKEYSRTSHAYKNEFDCLAHGLFLQFCHQDDARCHGFPAELLRL